MKIYHVSDTHQSYFEYKEADIFIHTGDICNYGTQNEFDQFLYWLKSHYEKYKVKIFVPGNHELFLKDEKLLNEYKQLLLKDFKTHLMFNETNTFFKTTFSSYSNTCLFRNWAFEASLNDRKKILKSLPRCDVLLSHTTPKSVSSFGCEALDNYIIKNKPKVLLCGHDHETKGEYIHENKQTKIYNSATVSNLITYER